MQNEIQILVGVPGSGKSTYANKLVQSDPKYIKISRDDIRHSLKNSYALDEDVENLVSSVQDAMIKAALSKGFNIVLDNTHCKAKYINELILKYGKQARMFLKIIGAELSIKEIKAQNLNRDKAVSEEVIDRMYTGFKHVVQHKKEIQQLINAAASEFVSVSAFKQNDQLPRAIVVDIDGTVAHHNDLRSPFEWHKVGQDTPDEPVLNIVRTLSNAYTIIFLSGRDESCRKETEDWLHSHYSLSAPIILHMRPKGSFEKDNIVKKKLFIDNVAPTYYVEAVLDDRKQVVDMWRNELGLKCLQVQEGNF
jgi:predicted kinase